MIFLFAAILAAATFNAAAADANDAAIESEYHQLLVDDDAAEQDILKWTGAGIGTNDDAKMALRMKVRQRIDNVRHEYEDFLLRHPNHVNGHIAFGSFLNDINEEEEAVAQWDTARLLAPTNPAPWNNLANYYGHRGPTKKAFEYYEKAIQLDPGQSVYYHNLGMLIYLFRPDAEEYYHLTEQQVFDKALDMYRKAIKLDPDDFVLFSDYAESFYGTKPPRWKDGLEAWTEALKIATNQAQREGVYIHLARINIKLDHLDAARAALAQVTAPDYAALKRTLTKNLHAAAAKDVGEVKGTGQ